MWERPRQHVLLNQDSIRTVENNEKIIERTLTALDFGYHLIRTENPYGSRREIHSHDPSMSPRREH